MAKKKHKKAVVGFVALGCPKNIVDSERMLAAIAESGLVITAEPDDADVVVINTCGFITPAENEALEAIKHAVSCKRKGTVKKVIVAGCLSERFGRGLFDRTGGIDAVVGLGQRDNIAAIIKKTLASNKPLTFLNHPPGSLDDRTRLLITPCHRPYLRISEGCSHNCSFCTIPAIRGRFRSKAQQLVFAEAAELAGAGAVELNIIGQDTTSYGRDLKFKNSLVSLLEGLEKITAVKWIRLMYAYPAGISDELLDAIAGSEKIVQYLDIPIQHVNDTILKLMRRPDTKEDICRLIERLRSAIPDIVLRTTVIVGFPGETDRQFAELLDFVEWAGFDALGCFTYCREAGTAAAGMPGQLPDYVKQKRLEVLMLTQQKIAFAKNRDRIGSELACLVDSVDDEGIGTGRFYGQAPEIDSVCIIENCSSPPGRFVDVEVTGSKDYDLLVRQKSSQP
jgi:ribosomal protein S12 methylthiotransferase